MAKRSDIRPGEMEISLPASSDAEVYFIGRIRTPFKSRAECPKNSAESQAVGTVELDPRYAAGLTDLGLYSHCWLLYWMDRARRDLTLQVPAHLGRARGSFALRSPVRPNPIAMSVASARHRGDDAVGRRARLPRQHAAARSQALFRLDGCRSGGKGWLARRPRLRWPAPAATTQIQRFKFRAG